MADNLVDEEWSQLFAQTEKELSLSNTNYPRPAVGSIEFMQTIDHTLLKLGSQPSQFDELCAEAKVNDFATVCVRPEHVQQCASSLRNTTIRVASVIGFHEGTHPTSHKLQELTHSISSGATELDLVINHPLLKSGSFSQIFAELSLLRAAAPPPIHLKLILETSQLTSSAIVAGCVLAGFAGMDYVKTSTGFNGRGASEEDVRIMRGVCEILGETGKIEGQEGTGRRMKVKASGGIRTLGDAVKMLDCGAERLGTSAGVEIAKQARAGGVGVCKGVKVMLGAHLG